MQAIIMAAGRGSRIAELTGGKPKGFLQVNGKPLIQHQLDLLREIGVDDITVVVGYQKQHYLEAFSDRGLRFVFNPFYASTNVLASFWFAQHVLQDDFLYFHADTVFHADVFSALLAAPGEIVLPIDRHACQEEEMKVRLDGQGHIIELNKTMDPGDAAGEFIGIAKVAGSVLPALRRHVEAFMEAGEFQHYFEAALQRMVDHKEAHLSPLDITGLAWTEVDFQEDLARARQLLGS